MCAFKMVGLVVTPLYEASTSHPGILLCRLVLLLCQRIFPSQNPLEKKREGNNNEDTQRDHAEEPILPILICNIGAVLKQRRNG
mmetsp:Transcript_18061/g.34755  ORF Transcript_18061/g.34755 Transcript_18061/m.34755 type:complete len:84 (-) Transcript_18061:1384-1635(-)